MICVGCGCPVDRGDTWILDQTPGFTQHPVHLTCYEQWCEAHKPQQRPLLMNEKPHIPEAREKILTLGERIGRAMARILWGA